MPAPRQHPARPPAALSANQILDIWEEGRRQHPIDRAITLIAAAGPEEPRRSLETLPIGERDRRLLELRRRVFGDRLSGQAACPDCAERLEFSVDADDFPGAVETADARGELRTDGYVIAFRAPDSRDLVNAAAAGTVAEARRALLECCVVEARHKRKAVTAAALPEWVVVQLAEAIASRDPLAEILIDLTCPACGLRWPLHFDIADFFWDEISTWVRHLLTDVHTLASAYGWSEADILSMSATRRGLYRGLLGA
ncbi:MAG: phage baseplate protein [Alphaproteobacteria bacterium]|nr:phage baseplate protein [Alphaproteobacteria bacterium]